MEQQGNYSTIEKLYNLYGKDKSLLEVFYENDYPVPFYGLYVYPIQVDMFRYFHILANCLMILKNELGDVEAISMSYLRFLLRQAEKGKPENLVQLIELLKVCFHLGDKCIIDDVEVDSIEPMIGTDNKGYIRINNITINSAQFDELKEIICNQNGLELPDETIHPDIRKAYEEAEAFRRKKADTKMCSFSDQMNVVIAQGIPKSEVLKMTIRTFGKLMERIGLIIDYELSVILSPNMDKTAQKKIKHYLADTSGDRYKDLKIDYDEFSQKITK